MLKVISIVISGVDKFTATAGSTLKTFDVLESRLNKLGRGFAVTGAPMLAGGLGMAHVLGLDTLPGDLIQAERKLVSLGNVGELTADQLKPIGKEILALQKITNQTQGSLYEGMDVLVASGLNPKIAIGFMKDIGRAATAEDADVKDLAQSTFTIYDNLKVPVNDLSKALNIMTLAGKRGRFELKDMAREFPSLSASARLLGMSNQQTLKDARGLPTMMTGPLRAVSQISAALQIARKGTGTSGEAATNLTDFYQKLFSHRVSESMQKITGDPLILVKTWSKALKEGKDPMLETLGYLDKLTTFKDPSYKSVAIGKIFMDREAQNFIKIMLPNLKEYATLRDEWSQRKPLDQDIISGDFSNIVKTTAEQWKLLKINVQSTLVPDLAGPLGAANNLLQGINGNALVTKGLLAGIGVLIGGGAILTGLGAMSFALSSIVTLLGSATAGAITMKTVMAGLGGTLTLALQGIAVVGAGIIAVMITDGLTKGLLGYKVGLGDIVMNGGYDNAMEAKRKADLRFQLKKMHPTWDDARIDFQLNRFDGRPGSTPAPEATFTTTDGAAGMGSYAGMGYYTAAAPQKVQGEVTVKLPNLPKGTEVTVSKDKGLKLQTDLGTYR